MQPGMQPGGFDIGALMESAQQMQTQIAQAQAALADRRVTGTAGGELVRADLDGNGRLVDLHIDPSVIDRDDPDTLTDLIVAAVRDGARRAEEIAQQTVSSVAGGLMGNLPGAGGAPGGAPGGAADTAHGTAPGSAPGSPPVVEG